VVLPVSGFLPVPLPMMIPFMGAQSLVIGKMFGEGFQYGKRKISAMPNEEFNKLTFEDMMSNARAELKASLPTINASLQDMQPMVEVVVREFFQYISIVTKAVTGTGEGPNIFQEEGHDIGDWIKEQLGIEHTPHGGAGPVSGGGVPIDVTPSVKDCRALHLSWTNLQNEADKASELMTKSKYNSSQWKQWQQMQQTAQRKLKAGRNANPECSQSWNIRATTKRKDNSHQKMTLLAKIKKLKEILVWSRNVGNIGQVKTYEGRIKRAQKELDAL